MTPHPVIARVREIGEQATKGPWSTKINPNFGGITTNVFAPRANSPKSVASLVEAADARAIVLDRNLHETFVGVVEAAQQATDIIETADRRAEAADGPVGHVRDEMSDKEWRDLYRGLRAALDAWTQAATQEIGEGR